MDTIKRVREEGRQAALAGKRPSTNPYQGAGRIYWNHGYGQGVQERQDLFIEETEEIVSWAPEDLAEDLDEL